MQEILNFCWYLEAIIATIGAVAITILVFIAIGWRMFNWMRKVRSDYIVYKTGNDEIIIEKSESIKRKVLGNI